MNTWYKVFYMFSSCTRFIAQDPKAKYKLNSNAHANSTIAHVKGEETKQYDHSTSELERSGKLSLGTMYFLPCPSLTIQKRLRPSELKSGAIIPGWDPAETHCTITDAAMAVAHLETDNPESAPRNANDILQYMETCPDLFQTPDRKNTVSALLILGDNSHGAGESLARLCFAMLFLLFDFDV